VSHLLNSPFGECDKLRISSIFFEELWLKSDGTIPTCTWFLNLLHGHLPNNIGGQSLRAGGATALAEAGVPSHMVQAIGRWSSATFPISVDTRFSSPLFFVDRTQHLFNDLELTIILHPHFSFFSTSLPPSLLRFISRRAQFHFRRCHWYQGISVFG